MNFEGRVLIDLPRRPGSPVAVELARPGDINRVLCGQTPPSALQLLPAVYAVCAIAQSHAAVCALEQAMGVSVSPATANARKALTAMETLREHLLRIALDWPGFIGTAPRGADIRPVMTTVARLSKALFGNQPAFAPGNEAHPDRDAAMAIVDEAEALLEAEVFAEPLQWWRARTTGADIEEWLATANTVASGVLHRVTSDGWSTVGATPAVCLQRLSSVAVRRWLQTGRLEDLIRTGSAQRPVPETTVYSRHIEDPMLAAFSGNGLAPRLFARLVELARLPSELRMLIGEQKHDAEPMLDADGFGWSAIDAARGLLVHAAQMQDGVIANYRILPPTRWNFDCEGVAKRCLSTLSNCDEGEKLRQAHLIVNAIDPCVAHNIRMH